MKALRGFPVVLSLFLPSRRHITLPPWVKQIMKGGDRVCHANMNYLTNTVN